MARMVINIQGQISLVFTDSIRSFPSGSIHGISHHSFHGIPHPCRLEVISKHVAKYF